MSDTSMPHPSELYPEHPLLAVGEVEDENPEDHIGEDLPDRLDEDDDEDDEETD